MSGPWRDYTRLLNQYDAAPQSPAKEGATLQGVAYRLLAQKLEIQAPNTFERAIRLEHLVSRGAVQRPDTGWRVDASQLDLSGPDMAARLQGHWRQHGVDTSGFIDLQGSITRLAIPAIKHYLPASVNPDAREWMERGLLAGQVNDASLVLRGDLDDFPFNDTADEGVFNIAGQYSGAIIDYLPANKKSPGWPRLVDMQGKVSLDRADLRLSADQAVMWPTPQQSIQLHDVQARIPNLEKNSVLSITGQTQADGNTYLALMTHTPLGGMLDEQFNETRATGVWSVPLALTIPLMHSRDTTVKGAIHFSEGDLRLTPEMPVFSKVTGTLEFSDTGFSTSDLKSEFLGGPVAISGGVGGALKGLRLQGTAQASAIREYTGLEGLKRLTGHMVYRAGLHQGKGKDRAFVLDIESDLVGLAMDFPPPLKKTTSKRLPLRISWQRHGDGKSMALGLALGTELQAKLLHRDNARDGAYFHAAALGVNKKAVLPKSGFALDLSYPVVDIDAWTDLVNEFSNTLPGADKARSQPLLPAIQTLRLQADKVLVKGVMLDTFTFAAHRPEPQQWRADISSSQTAGTLFWHEANGRVAGRIDANFDRLSLGSEQEGESSHQSADEFQIDDELDIPGVNLHVRKFRLYGRDVGELSLVGVNQARGDLWKLESLRLKSPSAELSGSGLWRLQGPNRGLTLDAEVQITNLGEYLDQIGQKDVMKAGEGTVKGKLEWHNMPWHFSRADLNGQIEFSLRKGRFSSLNSYSARLLELLSLQSVKRLARLDFNPAGLTREGFPYDDLRGTVSINNGLMSTSDYRVIGPVGTIVIGGNIDLVNELLDLQAVVIPSLDISGAAVAAGIAINPIVGVGAFLTQWLLQVPLAKAMTVQYQISGKWDDPKIKELEGPEPDAGARPATPEQPEPVIEH
nr:YhdP family protein [Pollutimonas harenae]